MNFLAIPSLRWRLVTVMILAYVIVAAATSIASYQIQESNLHTQLERQVSSDAFLLAAASTGPLEGAGPRRYLRVELQTFLSSLRLKSQGVEYAFVATGASTIVASVGQGPPPPIEPLRGSYTTPLPSGRLAAISPVFRGTLLGFVGVILSEKKIQSDLRQSLLVDTGLRTLGLVIFVLLSLVIARYILAPLAVLSRAAVAIRRGQLSARVSVSEGTELSTVAEAFNDMATSLEERITHLSFLAEAGAVLPNTFRESGDIDQVLLQFCNRLDAAGVYLTYAAGSTAPDIRFSRDEREREWQAPAFRFAERATTRLAGVEDGYAVMAVPVVGGAKFVASRAGRRPFTVEEQQVITNFAYQVGIAADNARLFEGQQEALRVKDQFLSIVSHELRTPLTTIKGYAQMLKYKLAGDADGKRFADTIDAQVGRLGRLVDDLLDVTRFTRGQFELKRETTNIRPLLEDVVTRFRLVAQHHTLLLDASDDDLLPGELDRDRIEQVMNNLVSNAIKYSPEGGEITVSALRRKDDIVVSVRDEGMGIPEKDQEHLFERFFRGSAEGQDIKGMGLGLYVTRRIVEAHGGSITVHSKPGEGTDLRFTLPLARVTAGVD
ncbi:MAG: ATP-binding protein [Chloroflexota bacterium]